MECFRIDESGYTGSDLLNADQRFQGASAVAIPDAEALRLVREHFPKIQASELKYRALSRRPGNHPRIISLLKDVVSSFKCATYVCDKRYLLTLMLLDYAVEPFYYERGIDFYKDGQQYGLASLVYLAGPTLFGQGSLDRLLNAFQNAAKEKTPGSLSALVEAARAAKWRELPEALGPLAQAAPECLSTIASPEVNTDAALIVLQSLISRMEVMADSAYCVEHDRSKNLLTYHHILQQMIEHDEEIEFRNTEIATLKFPLKLTAVAQVDSKTSPAVQVADVMIGSAIEAANTLAGLRSGGPDPEAILSLYADNQFIHLIPSLDFEEQKRFRRGSQGGAMIDYFAKSVFSRR